MNTENVLYFLNETSYLLYLHVVLHPPHTTSLKQRSVGALYVQHNGYYGLLINFEYGPFGI